VVVLDGAISHQWFGLGRRSAGATRTARKLHVVGRSIVNRTLSILPYGRGCESPHLTIVELSSVCDRHSKTRAKESVVDGRHELIAFQAFLGEYYL
jgi:hypothetical protein